MFTYFQKNVQKYKDSTRRQKNFENARRYDKIIFFKDDFRFFLCFLKHFGNSQEGSGPGPDFDQIFEVPEIIQKALEYDRGP